MSFNNKMVPMEDYKAVRDQADALRDEVVERRETCTAEQDYDRDEPPQARWWICHGCGEHFIFERGFNPIFCPNCGREIER